MKICHNKQKQRMVRYVRQTDKQMNGRMDRQIKELTYRWTDRQMDQMDTDSGGWNKAGSSLRLRYLDLPLVGQCLIIFSNDSHAIPMQRVFTKIVITQKCKLGRLFDNFQFFFFSKNKMHLYKRSRLSSYIDRVPYFHQ